MDAQGIARKAYEAYRRKMGGQAAIGNVSMCSWENLPQRARDGWVAAISIDLAPKQPRRATRKAGRDNAAQDAPEGA